jgi:ankyrin repeat protein
VGLRRVGDLGGGMGAGMTLHQAAAIDDVVEVRRLVAMGVNVDQRNADGDTALQYASAQGHVEMIKLLVQHGANKEANNADGATALHWAAFHGTWRRSRCWLSSAWTRRRRVRM